MKEIENAVENLSNKIDHLETLAENYIEKRERMVIFKAVTDSEGSVHIYTDGAINFSSLEIFGILDLFREDRMALLRKQKNVQT